jgi:hypothetical protein
LGCRKIIFAAALFYLQLIRNAAAKRFAAKFRQKSPPSFEKQAKAGFMLQMIFYRFRNAALGALTCPAPARPP